jgi:ubiquinone/menaquinone biosynthesis C-methylase UbiE
MMAEAARQAEADLWEPAGIVTGARVADVGCGPGALLAALAATVGPHGRITAVDADAEDAIVAHLATRLGPGGCLYLVDADGTALRSSPRPSTPTWSSCRAVPGLARLSG